MPVFFPNDLEALTSPLLNKLLQVMQPDCRLNNYYILNTLPCGDGQASTADRAILNLEFRNSCNAGIPSQVMLKTMLLTPHAPPEMYENEVRFYRDIRPFLAMETPQIYAADFDKDSGQFGLIMEDLSLRNVVFPNATTDISLEQIKGLLRTLADLHTQFWQSPRLLTDLAWIATPLAGGMSDIFQQYGYELVKDQVSKHTFKQDLIAPLNLSLDTMAGKLKAFQLEALQQPQTLLHGDTHIANTYLPPNGDGGLFDWQLLCRGNWAHDVSYVITTGLSIAMRRQHERELLAYYCELLRAKNVQTVPDADTAWYLYRKSIMWGLFIGWLITPPANYGEEITSANIRKLVQATQDLESFR
jgi:Ecdysteroid kinase-like family